MKETFEAYYFSLDATGDPKIDAILKAVARAGKGAHNTEDWNSSDLVRPIQEAANAAASGGVGELTALSLLARWRDTFTDGLRALGVDGSVQVGAEVARLIHETNAALAASRPRATPEPR